MAVVGWRIAEGAVMERSRRKQTFPACTALLSLLRGLLKRNEEAAVNAAAARIAAAEPTVPAPLPTIGTVLAQAAVSTPSAEKRPRPATIQVQAPDEKLPTAHPAGQLMEGVRTTQPHLLGGEPMYRDDI
ncbi:hypothetical protein FS837_005755 [Tulasnella sp. UAMH 9824]|nr:hypothetical protein FS837_005755 [Tulasnella sp. UAMH 9824]